MTIERSAQIEATVQFLNVDVELFDAETMASLVEIRAELGFTIYGADVGTRSGQE